MVNMRVAVISDVHARLDALDAVLKDIEQQGVEAIWCLGDVVGRGNEAAKVARKLKRKHEAQPKLHRAAWLAGNHDLMVLDKITILFLTESAGENELNTAAMNKEVVEIALQHRQELKHDPDLLEWLGHLPTHAQPFPGVFLAHGGFRLDPQTGEIDETRAYGEYTQYDDQARAQLAALLEGNVGVRVVLTGHTHIARLWQWSPSAERALRVERSNNHCYRLDNLNTAPIFVNVGSVGYPRGEDTHPTYVVLTLFDDMQQAEVEFRFVPLA